MMVNKINIIKNSFPINNIFKYDVILFSMGINNSMSKGFPYEIGLNFPEVLESENRTDYGNKRKLGTIHQTECDGITFVACYIHDGGYHKNENGSYINYEAFVECLKKVRDTYPDKKIATNLIGSNEYDGNFESNKIIETFNLILSECNVTIYTKERDYKLEIYKEICKAKRLFKENDISKEEYFSLRTDIEWRAKNGIYKERPDDFRYSPSKNRQKLLFRGKIKQY